ncbi:hypothetical protein GCM10020358_27680 [Amorphoplanes nipponensis]|uniref:Uncharacterized protein n=1 Tax=Actinoplanes nipponensis TaxID=135950 RepID=A0A919JA20_9ACTN|nr:hypothetical protein [Actinoplanes nipponensis]GIE46481.1 hypothetical protein Ani05nite_00150 [Actinoplanes nipponensis]
MTMWRKARTEVAGAWRSVRYDLARPERGGGVPVVRRGAGHPDVTSTGYGTFGGTGLNGAPRTSYGELVTRPRRLAAASAFGVLAVAGAAGSYFAVVNGMGTLVDKPAGVEPYPLAAAAPGEAAGELSNSGLGRGTANAGGRPAPAAPVAAPAQPVPGTIRVLPTTAGVTSPAGTPARAVVPRPPRSPAATKPSTRPAECCLTPPVPTPAPPAPTPYSPPATPAPTSSSPDTGESPEPSASPDSAAPSGSGATAGPDESESRTGPHGRR